MRCFPFVLGLATVVLAGCSSMNPFADKPVPPPCPNTRILADAAEFTQFRDGPGRDLLDVRFGGRMLDVVGACTHEIDKDTKAGTLVMELAPIMQIERGPADRDRVATVEYFVTILDSARKPLSRNEFDFKVPFEGNASQMRLADQPVTLTVPLKAGQTGRAFEILVGFRVSREGLDYNRRRGLPAAP